MTMLTPAVMRRAPAVLLTIGVLSIAGVYFAFCRPTPTPLPPAERKTQDSLEATRPDYTRRVDTLVRHETTYVAKSRQEARRAVQAERRADSLHAVAIAAEARSRAATDSARALDAAREANAALEAENTELRAANDKLHGAYAAESLARLAADARALEHDRRRAALEDVKDRLAADLARASAPCHVIPRLVNCPSRKVVAVVAAGVGFAIGAPNVREAAADLVRRIPPFSLIPGVRP